MSLLKDCTPVGPVGPILLAGQTWNPPFDNGQGPPGTGGPAMTVLSRTTIVNDASARFPATKYWSHECRPGDSYQSQSGERILLVRPQHPYSYLPGVPESFVEGQVLGQVRYYGISAKFHSPFPCPNRWLLFLQMKQIPSASPTWSLTISKNGSQPEGSGVLQMFLDNRSGPCTGGTPGPTFKYRADPVAFPPFLNPVPLDVWIDFIVGIRYEKTALGWSKVWWKLATDSTWNEVSVVSNDHTAMWDTATGQPVSSYLSQGIYRGTTTQNATHRVSLAGVYCALTFDDLATGVFGDAGSDPLVPPDPAAGLTRVGFTSAELQLSTTNDVKRVIRVNVGPSHTVTVTNLYALLAGAASGGSQSHQAVVYEPSGANPGALAGVGDAVTVAQAAAAAWVDVSPGTPFDATADGNGDLYIGLITGGPGQGETGRVVVTNGLWANLDTYAGGPSDPFGTPDVTSNALAICLDYELAVGGDTTPPGFVSGTAFQNTATLTYDELLDEASVPAASSFAVTVGGAARAVSQVAVAGATVVLQFDGLLILGSDTVTVSYTAPVANRVQDVAGNDAANLAGQALTAVGSVPTPTDERPAAGSRPSASRPSSGSRPSGPRPTGTPLPGGVGA